MNLVLKAVEFCVERHAGQVRKVSGLPYASHPLAVSYIVAEYKRSKKLEELLAAAILHDVLEDTNTSYEELETNFSPLVASLVQELTNDPAEVSRLGKLEYQKRKLTNLTSYALVIKLGDRRHNISDNPTPSMVKDTIELMTHLICNRTLSTTQLQMVNDILADCRSKKLT